MKKIVYLFTALIMILQNSCKKAEIDTIPLASLNVTNAIVGGTSAKFASNVAAIANNGFTQYGLVTGRIPLYIYPSADSLHPYVNSNITVNQGEVYSLFVGGTPAAIDTILIKENIPFRTDSTAGIRFINFAPNTNAKPINITLAATATTNEITSLAYKSYIDFKSYSGLYNSTYTFQVRNDTCASPKPPLAIFTLGTADIPRFANITLVVRQNGTGLAMFRVNNDR